MMWTALWQPKAAVDPPKKLSFTFYTATATGRVFGFIASIKPQTVDRWAKRFTSQSLREKVNNIQAGE